MIKANGYYNSNGDQKLTALEKLSFKLILWIGSPFSLVVHTLIFGGFFILRHLGIVSDYVLLTLTIGVCLEAIYLIIFIQMIVRKNTRNLIEVRENVENIQQEEEESQKLMINILHLAHQMKTLQHDVDCLKKNGIIKRTSGNGHRVHA